MTLPFDLAHAQTLLSRTPATLTAWLSEQPDEILTANEGADSWSAFDIVGHLIHGEKTDWMPRIKLILKSGPDCEFDPFDRFAQFRNSRGRSINDLLDEFTKLRLKNIQELKALQLASGDFERTGRHPALGTVTLRQLIATWVVHDYDHLMQIARVIGSQWAAEVGPWSAYLRVVSGKQG